MDKINDFFKDLAERFRSPLFSSFIISWIVINWRIPIVLLMYSHEEIKNEFNDGSIIKFIKGQADYFNFLLLPFISSLVYIFILPILRNYFDAFRAWADRWGKKLIYDISKTSHLPMDNIILLEDELTQKRSELNKIIENRSEIISEKKDLKEKLAFVSRHANELEGNNHSLNEINTTLVSRIKKFEIAQEPNVLNGIWEIKYEGIIKKDVVLPSNLNSIRIQINSYVVNYPYTQSNFGIIKDFLFAPERNKLFFSLKLTKRDRQLYFILEANPNVTDIFVGKQIGDIEEYQITLSKLDT